jgi:hypothetical protein
MLGAARYAPSIFLLSIFLLIVNLHPESVQKNAFVPPNEKTTLHADPGIEHPLKPTFKDADRVAVKELARKRYFGVPVDGRNEPVHTKLWTFVNEAVAQTSDSGSGSSKTPATESKEPTKKADSTSAKIPPPPAGKPKGAGPSSKAPSPPKSIPSVDKPPEENNLPEKSPSVLQMLEGHERELMIAAAIAAAFFFIGWICGGHYYLRRDRRRRTKIRF